MGRKQDGKLSVYARCRVVYYCSKAHQTENWEEHRKICKKLGQSQRDEKAMSKMKVDYDLPLFIIKKRPCPPLKYFNSWQYIWEYLACYACKEIFQKRMAEALS